MIENNKLEILLYFLVLGKDDTLYAEHRPVKLKLNERPPSSPSRFDLKTRIHRSQSQHQDFIPQKIVSDRPKSPVSLFQVIHRPPSQSHTRLSRPNTAFVPNIKSYSSM